MGTIGLFDGDLATFGSTMFNLELMKLSSYLKKKNNIVSLIQKFEPEKFSEFYYWKDYNTGFFNNKISKYFSSPNFHYGGLVFSNNKYKAMDEEIEKSIPDFSLYLRYRDLYNETKSLAKDFRTMVISPHFRLSLDGKTINEDNLKYIYTKNSRTYICHDNNIPYIEGAREYLNKIINQEGKYKGYIATKFPVVLADQPEELVKWQTLRWSGNMSQFCYYGFLDDQVFADLVEVKSYFCKMQRFEYVVTHGCTGEDEFLKVYLPKIYRQAKFLQMNRIKIFLKYEEDFFQNKRIERLIDLINFYISSIFSWSDVEIFLQTSTFLKFVNVLLSEGNLIANIGMAATEGAELMNWVKNEHYPLYSLFKSCHRVHLSNGVFVDD